MRRSWAWMSFGALLTMLAIATISARSHAANPTPHAVDFGPVPPFDAKQFLQRQREEESLFGGLIKAQPALDVLPSDEACPWGMIEVEGDYCPVVEQNCRRWLDVTKLQCAEFEKRGPSPCPRPAQHEHFCIDQYEWPNRSGALPDYMASWYDAKASCESLGKRLCRDTEWTLACEGPEKQPYPYGDGYARDDLACNIDKPYIWPQAEKFANPATRGLELARLDQREPSGSRAGCVSPYGVHDMVGNVDEWVVNVSQSGQPHLSGLKGGYWGPVRTRCRPMTTAHDEAFRYYQIGFRCCGDAHVLPMGGAPMAMQ